MDRCKWAKKSHLYVLADHSDVVEGFHFFAQLPKQADISPAVGLEYQAELDGQRGDVHLRPANWNDDFLDFTFRGRPTARVDATLYDPMLGN